MIRKQKPSWLDLFLNAEWEETRQRGRGEYVRSRVLFFGVPVGLSLGVWSLLDRGLSFGDFLSPPALLVLLRYLLVAAAVMFVEGQAEWVTRERKYREAQRRE